MAKTKCVQGLLTENEHKVIKAYATATKQSIPESVKDFVWCYLDHIKGKLEDGQTYVVHAVSPVEYQGFAKLVAQTGDFAPVEKKVRVQMLLIDEEIKQIDNWQVFLGMDNSQLFNRAFYFNLMMANRKAAFQDILQAVEKETQNA